MYLANPDKGFCLYMRGQCLKAECKHLPNDGPAETQFVVRLRILIRDRRKVLDSGWAIVRNVQGDKSLPRAEITVLNPAVYHIREYLLW